jgi:AhpD family alkylhydroperoxidase
MTKRINPYTAGGSQLKPLVEYSVAVEAMGLETSLMELVKIRASQINGCASCLHFHTRNARSAGETEARIYVLGGWRDSPLFTDRERAALGWTEALTQLGNWHAVNEAYEPVAAQFTPEEQIALNLLVGTINALNRLNIGFAVEHPVAAADQRAAA